eukprot:9220209-Karenia_brevis.AAC.1
MTVFTLLDRTASVLPRNLSMLTRAPPRVIVMRVLNILRTIVLRKPVSTFLDTLICISRRRQVGSMAAAAAAVV